MSMRGPQFWVLLGVSIGLVSARDISAQTVSSNEPRFSRRISVVKPGPQALSVDLELLAGAEESLADVRLFNEASREVPYLLVPPRTKEPTWVEGVTIRPIVAARGESGFEADFARAQNIDRIRVSGLSTPLMKRLRVEGSTEHHRYATLIADATLFDLPDEGLEQLELPLAAGEYKTLRVVWDDRASSPVGLPRAVQARLFEIQAEPEPVRFAVPFEPRPARNSVSQWQIHLPARALPVTAIVLNTKQEQLLRVARVSESRLEGGKLESHGLGNATLRRATHHGLVAANLRIPIQRPDGNELTLAVENGNNPPLTVDDIAVELHAQPALYFEADKPGTFTMRYGSKAAAPSYDLEAERAAIGTKAASIAKFMGAAEPLVASVPRPSSPVSSQALQHGSALDPKQFAYRRPILATNSGMLSLRLDATVLAHSGGLQDLRILDSNARQVPYIIEHESEPLLVELAARLLADKERPKSFSSRISAYSVRLPLGNLPSGTLVFTTEQRVFRRQVFLYAVVPAHANKPARTREIAQATWLHDNPNQDVPRLELPIREGTEQELVLAIDDGDNDKLPLQSSRLELPANSLKFFRNSNEALILYYGAPNLAAPDYDLALLADEINTLSPGEASLAPENSQPAAVVKANSMLRWFWGVLVFTVVALVALIARLVRRTDVSGKGHQ